MAGTNQGRNGLRAGFLVEISLDGFGLNVRMALQGALESIGTFFRVDVSDRPRNVDDLSPADARRLLGPKAIVGYSTHTIEQIDRAVLEPASYIAVGPVFGTTTKDTGYSAVGLDLVRSAVARAQDRPVVAIGGVTLERAASVIAAGAAAVAVIGDLLSTGKPEERVRSYLEALA